MSLDAINQDDYGYIIKLTYIDTDTDAAADISGFTTAQYMVFKDPDDNQAEKTAAFDSDGSDGIVKYTIVDGDIDEPGTWHVRLKIQSGSSILRSNWKSFQVQY